MPDLAYQIKKLSFFTSLDALDFKALAEISTIKKYPKDSILFYENDTNNKVHFLIEGLLKVYKIDKYDNEIFLYHIYDDSMISELTTIDESTIHCFSNAEFTQDSIVLEVDFDALKEKFLTQGILNIEFINEILKKTSQLHCVVNRELVFDATAKVAFMLWDDLEMFNSKKRQEVSFMLHIQPETLSRVLKKLTRNQTIEITNSKITILNHEKLKNIYKGEK